MFRFRVDSGLGLRVSIGRIGLVSKTPNLNPVEEGSRSSGEPSGICLGVLRIRGDALVFKPPSKDQKPH